jgi:O-antigen/teichoic acid export membrane protein
MVLLATFAAGIIVARVLGPAGRGVVGLLAALTAVLASLMDLGMSTALPYFYKFRSVSARSLLRASALAWACGAAVICGLLLWRWQLVVDLCVGTSGVSSLHPKWLWLAFAAVPCMLVQSTLGLKLIVNQETRLFAAWSVVPEVLRLALICVLVVALRLSIPGVLLANLGAGLVATVALLAAALGRDRGEIVDNSALLAVRMVRVGIQQFVVSLIASLFKRGQLFLLVAFSGWAQVGNYAVGAALYEVLNEVARAAVWPLVGSIAEEGQVEVIEGTTARVRRQVILSALVMAFAVPAGLVMVPIAYGGEFAPAAWALAVLLLGLVPRAVHLAVSSFFIAKGKPIFMAPGVAVGTVTGLLFGMALIPNLGALGAATASTTGEFGMALGSSLLYSRAAGVKMRMVWIPRKSELWETSRALWSLLPWARLERSP